MVTIYYYHVYYHYHYYLLFLMFIDVSGVCAVMCGVDCDVLLLWKPADSWSRSMVNVPLSFKIPQCL